MENQALLQPIPGPNDIAVYVDNNYIVYRRNGLINGTLSTPIDLLFMGINGISQTQLWKFIPALDYNYHIKMTIHKLANLIVKE